MRRRLALCLSLMAAASASVAFGQTPSSPTQTPPVMAPTAPPVPESQMSAPKPDPVTPTDTPSMPAYDPAKARQQPAPQPSQTAPTPTPSPAPVVAPAQVTTATPYVAVPQYGIPDEDRPHHVYGSTYIPVDSWVYVEMTRLYSLGYCNTMFLSMRPWTRQTVLNMLEDSEDDIRDSDSDEAKEIYAAVMKELALEDTNGGVSDRGAVYGAESYYTRLMGISGPILRDSYHLGQTLVNDYGRPYEPGFNSILGASTVNEYGRFSLYVRGEYQHSPGGTGYTPGLAYYLSSVYDDIPYTGYNASQIDIPQGNIAAANPFRLIEATLSFKFLGHEISGGKSDAWLGPAQGGALAWSNNAQDIYSFRINRVDPLYIPLLSRLLGPMRYDFFYGDLKGHTAPNDDWVHSEMFAFRPTRNFEFGFQRTIIFGGKGHEPVTLHTFLKGFFDLNDTTGAEKYSRDDPGARFSAFNMSYRMPFLRNYLTFVADAESHDDVTPVSAPRRAAFRTGFYLSQLPMMRKLDLRFEVADTDQLTDRSTEGSFNYYETIQLQGYTNDGFIMGDWMGREAKGGQAWITYHLSGNEWVQAEFLNKKNDKDFGPGAPNPNLYLGFNQLGGTTQNSFKLSVVKRLLHNNLEVNGWFQYERWTVPSVATGPQTDTSTAIQLTFFPGLKSTGSH